MFSENKGADDMGLFLHIQKAGFLMTHLNLYQDQDKMDDQVSVTGTNIVRQVTFQSL